MLDKFQKHPFVRLFGLCAVVVASTWAVSHHLLVAPRNDEITRLKDQLSAREALSAPSPIVLLETGVNTGNSATTTDGLCTVHVISAAEAGVSLSVTLGSAPPQLFKSVAIGGRIIVRGDTANYYVDLLRARGGIVDLTVSKHSDV
ncbi:hypothetical protein QEK82_000302 [Stenotrophomonas maltophilia]|uniref:hypothetical protein n=1 Tax=Stenotrophomonas maltophilia group sp. Smal13 TaxID=3377166 RepID=UPI002556E113|nr:hypothetical protein [Stenotrophomonas maltophilia]EKU9957827.1 hypothetical protein [Stenotrophomonas maltophilia]EKU9983538.1 hypothetical protein [Stenotrophomonas maltophilia]